MILIIILFINDQKLFIFATFLGSKSRLHPCVQVSSVPSSAVSGVMTSDQWQWPGRQGTQLRSARHVTRWSSGDPNAAAPARAPHSHVLHPPHPVGDLSYDTLDTTLIDEK